MPIDDRIRDALRQAGEHLPVDPVRSLDRSLRTGRLRFRRRLAGVLTGLLVIAGAGVALVAGPDRPAGFVNPSASLPTGPRSQAPTGGAIPAEVPQTYVALLYEDGETFGRLDRLALVSTRTGAVVRVLYRAGADASLGRFSLSADGAIVYLSERLPDRGEEEGFTSTLLSVSVPTGTVTRLGDGSDPAISRDGGKLAYVGARTDRSCGKHPLVVRDLHLGSERIWRWRGEEGTYDCLPVTDLAWSADGRHLSFARTIGDPRFELRLLDTTQGDDILDSVVLSPLEESWRDPAFASDGRIWAVAATEEDLVDGVERKYTVIVLPDERGGQPVTAIHSPFDGSVVDIDFDATGRWLILTSVEEGGDGRLARSVYVLVDGELQRIGKGALAAGW